VNGTRTNLRGWFDGLRIDLVRAILFGPPHEHREITSPPAAPGATYEVATARVGAYLLAVVLPAALAALVIPFRASLEQSAAILLVLPILVVAAATGRVGPAVTAACVAAGAFDLFLTVPHYRPVIDDSDDVVATVSLLVVGILAGVTAARLAGASARNRARLSEIDHLSAYALHMANGFDEGDAVDEACERLTDLLSLTGCTWRPSYHGTAAPVLLPTGGLLAYMSDLPSDGRRLPRNVELPVVGAHGEHGRFMLEAGAVAYTSMEERRTAAAVAALLGHQLDDRPDAS
jgi:hypothetical protein